MLVELLLAIMISSKGIYIQIFKELRANNVAPSTADAFSPIWCTAAALDEDMIRDVSACALLADILESEHPSFKKNRTFHSQML